MLGNQVVEQPIEEDPDPLELAALLLTECLDPVFATGRDTLRDLEQSGVTSEGDDLAGNPVIRAAWDLHGASFMARWYRIAHRENPWAAETFGIPEEI